jgi:hypothetical protein
MCDGAMSIEKHVDAKSIHLIGPQLKVHSIVHQINR